MEELIAMCKRRGEEAGMLLDALQMLQTEGPVSQVQGICGNTQYYLYEYSPWGYCEGADLDDWLFLIWPLWDYWTGSKYHPVPASRTNLDQADALAAYGSFQEWDGSTEYGLLRLDLLNHCIITLQEAIDRAKD